MVDQMSSSDGGVFYVYPLMIICNCDICYNLCLPAGCSFGTTQPDFCGWGHNDWTIAASDTSQGIWEGAEGEGGLSKGSKE